MAKGCLLRIDPFYPNDQLDFLPPVAPKKPARIMSATGPALFPNLRGLDDIPSRRQQKKPLLTLKLSSPSFLDSKVNDGLSDNPLYTIETANTCTIVSRSDPWDGSTKTADIRWPKRIPVKSKGKQNMQGVYVQMHGGPLRAVEHVLKSGTLSGSRSFNLPNCPHTFKWRRSGSSYHCTTSIVKGPVATLDAASSVPPTLRVFETLPVQDSRLDRGGVSINLLDHLLITALLLVTDAEEWVTLARPRSASVSDDGPHSAPASVRQWRKIVYGEPLFPSLRSPNSVQVMESSDVMDISPSPASRPASMRQWRKIVYGEPLFPSLKDSNEADDLSRSSTPWDDTSLSSASINYPSTPVSSSPASHGYLDPSFYEVGIPPMPEHPFQYPSTPSLLLPPSRPSSTVPTSSTASPRRELPKPPSPPSLTTVSTSSDQPYLHRCQSTPYLTHGVPALSPRRPPATLATIQPPTSWRAHHPADSPSPSSGGTRIRLLPQPPQTTSLQSVPTPTAVPIRSYDERGRPVARRSLPATPTGAGPSLTAVTIDEEQEHGQSVRQTMQKEAEELADWMRSLTQQGQRDQHNQASQNAMFDAPPPAYNAIDFSHPPHASAPHPPLHPLLTSLPPAPSLVT